MKDAPYLAAEFAAMESEAKRCKLRYPQGSTLWSYHEGRELAYRDCRLTCQESLPSLRHEPEVQAH